MKKHIVLLTILASVVLYTSCSDTLDAEMDGRIEFEEIFKNQDKIQNYYNSCLSGLIGPDLRSMAFSDEGQHASFHEDNNTNLWYTGQITTDTHPINPFGGDPWAGAYGMIRRCNIFLSYIDKETAGLVRDQKEGWKSEVYAMRGYYYWQLAKRYGGVPLFLDVIQPDHDFTADKKAPFSDVVRQVIADCEKALEGPDTAIGYPWGFQDRMEGHLTPAGAHAVMSEAVTYATSPLWDDGSISKEYATQITGRALYECLSHGYELFNSTSDQAQNAYALYFLTLDDRRATDKETIYRVGGQMSLWNECGLPSTSGQTSAGYCPSQNIVDSYEMQATGLSPITGYSDNNGLIPVINPASGYDEKNPYAGRDPRFEASIYYNGAPRLLTPPDDNVRDDHFMIGLDPAVFPWDIDYQDKGDYCIITTLGGDPNVYSGPLMDNLNVPNDPPKVTITFDYKLNRDIDNAQFFYGRALAEGGVSTGEDVFIAAATEWTTFEYDITEAYYNWGWGFEWHRIRFDIGNQPGAVIHLKNFQINVVTPTVGNMVETYVGGSDGQQIGNKQHTPTGYYTRKYAHFDSKQGANKDGAMRVFRLAELYLNFAETAYKSHGPDAKVEIGPGMSMSARDAVNAVRARAQMPDFPAGMSAADFEKKYRNERRIELAFEGHRSFDVRRWKILNETDKNISGMKIEKDGKDFIYNRFVFDERKCNTDKFLIFPINRNELYKIRSQTGENWQNPGWDY
ncbi:RagB/SusD family nutrient uptake outer membrane protein [Dysgonomonas sp. 521]|uniref:RagB/SusD family nutrient uptake outer membrane protein n=1 Tax=Dysgonomonas sp. 521 TaxID=2302932 RepID=UPI0013D03BFA|nr:RagB/SusD family nutrient uptake outer membrane protein [Dysgonomonas sp. 521]NDV93971.1 RagB/SusD family nutrient uptake outer membrane protein [Dysgonomonas sp. 521]